MIEIVPINGIGEIKARDNLGLILADALAQINLEASDFVVVTQKIVSKAEGRMVFLDDVTPGEQATQIAQKISKDPRIVELVLSEAQEVLRAERGVLITRHKLGFVMANSGIDCSNLGAGHSGYALLLPEDPDKSASNLAKAIEAKSGVRPGVIISDSFGRPWRNGVVNVAVGCDGVPSLFDKRGEVDRDGRVLQATLIAYGDLIASAAGLAMGEGAEGIPVAVLKGLKLQGLIRPASALVRAVHEDLFR